MPRISLTDFVDIVSASGTPKATKVKQVKHRPPYHPAIDYYKQMRDGIVETHQISNDKSELQHHVGPISDAKKVENYGILMHAYKKWWGKKDLDWFDAPDEIYSAHGVDVSINPEVGLSINGTPHLVKLYFKADGLAKNKIDIITHLMQITLQAKCKKAAVMSVLDIRNSKLLSPTVPIPGLDATVNAELAYIAALWPNV